MEDISLTCPACKQALKFPGARAGLKAECTNCGEPVTVPKPPAAGGGQDDDEEDSSAYGLSEGPVEEKKVAPKKKKEKQKSAIQKRKKAINEPELWAKVLSGLLFFEFSAYIWAVAFAMETLIVLLGIAKGHEYASVRAALMTGEERDLCRFAVGLVAGLDLLGVAMFTLILACVVLLAKCVVAAIGYGICLGGPNHFGMGGQCVALIVIAGINAVCVLFFKLFPLLGIMPFTLLEVVTPTLPCLEANYERLLPLQIFWGTHPFWELILSFAVLGCFYFESVLASIYLRCVGMASKEPLIADAGTALSQLGMGTMFVLLAFNMFALTGTSEVMISVLRLIYLLWSGFIVLFIVRYIQCLALARRRIGAVLEGVDLDKGEDDDDEEEDEKPRKSKAKKRRPRDEDEDEDDEDEEEEKPRKRKKKD